MDVMDAGRMAVFAHPAAGVLGVWQAGRHTGAELVNEPGALNWNELQTRDVEGAKAFGEAVFGWKPEDQDFGGMTYTLFNVGDTGVAGAMRTPSEVPDEVPAFWLSYFTVEDCDAAVAKVQELGGRVFGAPHTPRGRRALRGRRRPARRDLRRHRRRAARGMSHTGAGAGHRLAPVARHDGWAALFWSAFKDSRNAMVLLDEHRRHVDVNGAYLKLAGYTRDEVIGRPVWEYVAGGPLQTDRQWERAVARGELSGEAGLVCADGTIVTVQFAGHTEVATGQRLVLFVVLSTSRWGRHSRRDPKTGTDEALSAREREIVRLVAAGQTGPEIAEHLHISHATVRTHVRNAMAKVGARSRAHLVAKALGDGHAVP